MSVMLKAICCLVFLGLFSTMSQAETVTLINRTDQPLCLYTGNTLLHCKFYPNTTATVQLPTHTIYHRKAVTNDNVMVSDPGTVVEAKENCLTVQRRQGISLCQKRSLNTLVQGTPWEIRSGLEPGCSPAPQYPVGSINWLMLLHLIEELKHGQIHTNYH